MNSAVSVHAQEQAPQVNPVAITRPLSQWSDAPAPARFRMNEAQAKITFHSPYAVDTICRTAQRDPVPANMTLMACANQTAVGRGEIQMPNPCLYPEEDFYAHLLCHEIAHLWGWSALHEP